MRRGFPESSQRWAHAGAPSPSGPEEPSRDVPPGAPCRRRCETMAEGARRVCECVSVRHAPVQGDGFERRSRTIFMLQEALCARSRELSYAQFHYALMQPTRLGLSVVRVTCCGCGRGHVDARPWAIRCSD